MHFSYFYFSGFCSALNETVPFYVFAIQYIPERSITLFYTKHQEIATHCQRSDGYASSLENVPLPTSSGNFALFTNSSKRSRANKYQASNTMGKQRAPISLPIIWQAIFGTNARANGKKNNKSIENDFSGALNAITAPSFI